VKIRETSESDVVELVYYEREDIPKPKTSKVYILRFEKSVGITDLLQKILKVKTVVEKLREVYFYKGTRIHLDKVKDLGFFVEFERRVTDQKADRRELLNLMEELNLDENQLVSLSYSDLLGKK